MKENGTKEMDLSKGIEDNLQAEFNSAKAQLKAADTIVDNYRDLGARTVIKAGFPIIGDLIDESLCAAFKENQTKKKRTVNRHNFVR